MAPPPTNLYNKESHLLVVVYSILGVGFFFWLWFVAAMARAFSWPGASVPFGVVLSGIILPFLAAFSFPFLLFKAYLKLVQMPKTKGHHAGLAALFFLGSLLGAIGLFFAVSYLGYVWPTN